MYYKWQVRSFIIITTIIENYRKKFDAHLCHISIADWPTLTQSKNERILIMVIFFSLSVCQVDLFLASVPHLRRIVKASRGIIVVEIKTLVSNEGTRGTLPSGNEAKRYFWLGCSWSETEWTGFSLSQSLITAISSYWCFWMSFTTRDINTIKPHHPSFFRFDSQF